MLLYPPEENSNSPKVDVTQSRMEDFVSVPKLPVALVQAKMLTEVDADYFKRYEASKCCEYTRFFLKSDAYCGTKIRSAM